MFENQPVAMVMIPRDWFMATLVKLRHKCNCNKPNHCTFLTQKNWVSIATHQTPLSPKDIVTSDVIHITFLRECCTTQRELMNPHPKLMKPNLPHDYWFTKTIETFDQRSSWPFKISWTFGRNLLGKVNLPTPPMPPDILPGHNWPKIRHYDGFRVVQLVVEPTPLKNMLVPILGVKIKHIWKHHQDQAGPVKPNIAIFETATLLWIAPSFF